MPRHHGDTGSQPKALEGSPYQSLLSPFGINMKRALAPLGACLVLMTACEGVQIGSDALSLNLTPRQAQACRDATRDALAEHNVYEEWIRRIHYQAIRPSRRSSSTRPTGFEAWVFPQSGGGVLVVELTIDCQVRRVRAQGTR